MKLSTVKALAKRRLGANAKYTFVDEKKILSILKRDYPALDEQPIVLFYPNRDYWALLTDKNLWFLDEAVLHQIQHNSVTNWDFLEKSNAHVTARKKVVKCHNLSVEYTFQGKPTRIRLPIEDHGILSFTYPMAYLTNGSNPML